MDFFAVSSLKFFRRGHGEVSFLRFSPTFCGISEFNCVGNWESIITGKFRNLGNVNHCDFCFSRLEPQREKHSDFHKRKETLCFWNEKEVT